MENSVWEKRRKRLFELIEIGSNYDAWCWGYDFFNTFTIILNLAVSIMYTFDNMELRYGPLLLTLERMTVAFLRLIFCFVYTLPNICTRIFRSRGQSGSTFLPSPELWICCHSFLIICRSFSRQARSHSVCCESSGSSDCSASMLIMIH